MGHIRRGSRNRRHKPLPSHHKMVRGEEGNDRFWILVLHVQCREQDTRTRLTIAGLDEHCAWWAVLQLFLGIGQLRARDDRQETLWRYQASARRIVRRSIDWVPRNVQYCLGRLLPKRARMKDCSRRPSPPARITPHK
jgi:hypothetical protein